MLSIQKARVREASPVASDRDTCWKLGKPSSCFENVLDLNPSVPYQGEPPRQGGNQCLPPTRLYLRVDSPEAALESRTWLQVVSLEWDSRKLQEIAEKWNKEGRRPSCTKYSDKWTTVVSNWHSVFLGTFPKTVGDTLESLDSYACVHSFISLATSGLCLGWFDYHCKRVSTQADK